MPPAWAGVGFPEHAGLGHRGQAGPAEEGLQGGGRPRPLHHHRGRRAAEEQCWGQEEER